MKLDEFETVGGLATRIPDAAPVMEQFRIDYCCGGKDVLADVLAGLPADSDTVISELETATQAADNQAVADWSKMSRSQIVDYLLDNHHIFMKETLEELNMLMFRILKVHYKSDGESLLKIHKLFGTLKTELEEHLVKEEENLFPLIVEYDESENEVTKQAILKFIKDTEDEHDAAGDLFKALEVATNDFTAPEHACYSYKRTFELLDALEKDTFNHIHTENSILFPMI